MSLPMIAWRRKVALIAGLLATPMIVWAQEADSPPPDPSRQEVQLQLNFRGVSLDTVLDYLSQAAGFVITRDEPVEGTVDIISHHPLNRDEAVELLHTVLNDKGYALLRTGRFLRIVKREDARTRDLPVISGSDPAAVPRSGEMVTQIVPVRHTNAAKLIDTLKPLMPTGTVITANEDSNSLVITDTQTSINRIMQIIQALDTAVSSILDIAVIPLRYADAQETADVINKVYETPTQRNAAAQSANNRRASMIARFRGGDMPEADANTNEVKQTSSYIRAVADQRGNAVVVTAPAESIPQIRQLVLQLDTASEAFSTLQVFQLQFADAVEIANVLAGLYPDPTTSRNQTASSRFGRRGFPQPQPQTESAGESRRQLAEAKVMAVADTRTNSVIVSASPSTMVEIETMIVALDATPQNLPTVFIYQLENADLQTTKSILDSMFSDLDGSNSTNRSTTTRATGATTTTGGRTTQSGAGTGNTSGATRR